MNNTNQLEFLAKAIVIAIVILIVWGTWSTSPVLAILLLVTVLGPALIAGLLSKLKPRK